MRNIATLAAALAIGAASLFASIATAHEYTVGELEIGHPWGRATPPGAKTGGGYLTITNKGDADDRLISVETSFATKGEVHEMSIDNGIMKMRPLSDGLPVAAGETVELAPGGLHLMFMGLKQPFNVDERVPVTLTFEKAGSIDVELAIEARGKDKGHEGH